MKTNLRIPAPAFDDVNAAIPGEIALAPDN
jgi:hypothetical protein